MAIAEFWDNVKEYELDPSWKTHWAKHESYRQYRERFEKAQKREYLGDFPLAIEIEASYYCNLRCPYCPRASGLGEREVGHMTPELWQKIVRECSDNRLSSILMDHEAESMMNPRFFDMVKDAKDGGILDIWLHTNANLLNKEKSHRLIDNGITKINFSIDAATPSVYEVLRVGGKLETVIRNIKEFLAIKKEKQAHYLRTRVSFVEQKENLGEKKAFFETWKSEPELNLVTFQECVDFKPFEKPDDDAGLSEKELEKKYASSEPFHCSMPWEMPVIDIDGNVIPCGSPVREHNKDFILGNLNTGDTIKSCWNGKKMKTLRELHSKGEWYKNPMCRVCVKTLRQSHNDLEALKEAL